MNKKLALLSSILATVAIFFSATVFAKELSLKQKIGQMIIIGFKEAELKPDSAVVKAILAQQIGGVILFNYDFQTKTYQHNIESPQQLLTLTKQLQGYAQEAAPKQKNDLIPLLISIDYEGGKVNRLKEDKGFPKTLSAVDIAKVSDAQAATYANQMGKVLRDEGINMNFAPVLDVNVNPNNPVIGKLNRSFSSDPNVVAKYGQLFSKAFHDNGIICAYKHFPGHGSSLDDSHAGFVDVTKTWQSSELTPYTKLLNQPDSCPMIMMAHIVNYQLDKQGYPASLSHAITTDLLRKKMNFNGVVVSDDMQMKAITDNYGLAQAVRLSINAGTDILVFGNQLVATPQNPAEIVDLIYADVQSGKISKNRIDEAFARIMKLKRSLPAS